jgi:hypothetical protein
LVLTQLHSQKVLQSKESVDDQPQVAIVAASTEAGQVLADARSRPPKILNGTFPKIPIFPQKRGASPFLR